MFSVTQRTTDTKMSLSLTQIRIKKFGEGIVALFSLSDPFHMIEICLSQTFTTR